MTQTRSPTLAQTIRAHIAAALDELHTCLPGVVTDYDPTTQRASVKPLVRHAYRDEQDDRRTESLAVVTGVPVQFMAAGGFALTCPISTGSNGLGPATTGVLFFSEASLDRWLSGSGAEVDPEIDHRHALTDGVFVPGLQPFGAPLAGVPADHAALGAVGGVQAHFRKDVIVLGDEATAGFVALASRADSVLAALVAARAAFVAAGGTLTEPAASIAFVESLAAAIALPSWPTSTAATQAKAT